MIRARPPVWLGTPGRFASLRPGHALAVLLLIVAALLAVLVLPGEPARPDPVAQDAIVEEMREGGDYYSVAAQALRAEGEVPARLPAFRLPTLAVVQAALPDIVVVLILLGIAVASVLAWARRIREWFVRPAARTTAYFLLAGGMVAFVQPGLVRVHDIWAGLLIAWSLAMRREDRWVEAAAIACCATLLRETAALYAVVMLGAALFDRRRHEALGWAVVFAVFLAVLALHARAAGLATGPLDPASSWWGGLHVPGPFAATMAQSTVLTLLPVWIGAPVALLALAGWIGAPGPFGGRTALVFGGYALATALTGRAEIALVVAPAFLVGLAFVPDAARDLTRGLLDRRRVRVHRITR